MNLESKKTEVNYSSEAVKTYLSDLNNMQYLLPKGKYSDWEGSADKCSFKIQGYKISLEKVAIEDGVVKMKTGDGSPVEFNLNFFVNEVSGDKTETQIKCDGKVNAFLQMMIKKPLSSLFDYMSERLEKVEM